jgi:carboxypeptidase Taq
VEADELTYHLHVLLRFELERAMLRGDLSVKDLPAAWNDRMKRYLGKTPPNDADGCLQDIHWSLGALAYFPTYTLGTILSAQLYDAAARDLGDIGQQIGAGNYDPLLDWLRENVHRHGRAKSAATITAEATRHPLSAEPWLAYAKAKYSALYDL